MSNLKINSNLFVGSAELNRLQYFLQDVGYKRNILENSVSFGLIKSNEDISFTNGLIQPDIDVISGGVTFKAVKNNDLAAIDSDGNFITKPAATGILIPGDGDWYWIRAQYQISNIEKGTFSLSADGTLSGTGGELTKLLRGFPKIASRIRFIGATLNTLDYDVLEVIDDNHAILNGVSFQNETNLSIAIVGSFTYGVAVSPTNKLIFNYDSCLLELIPETVSNTLPAAGYVNGKTFYLARVKSDGTSLILQDKRNEYWETKGSNLSIDTERNLNPLIGIESIKYNHPFTPQDKNVVELSWGFRSNNWSVNSATNVLTMTSGTGGKYKTIPNFTDGDFNGWRLYYQNGNYSRIITSVKQGSAINLTLDHLDVDNLSPDGGNTFNVNEYVIAVPNAEEIEILFKSDPTDNQSEVDRSFVFPINELTGKCEVLVYKSTSVLYNVQYRYKTYKEYSEYQPIPTDTANGYYNESSFDADGNIVVSPVRQIYTSDPTDGFVILLLSDTAYTHFISKVDKGDLIGTTTYTDSVPATINLHVGINNNYLFIGGNVVLTANVQILLNTDDAIDGNEFRIHLNCASFDFSGFTMQIVAGNISGTTVLRNITQADIYKMQNIDGGIVFDCKFKSTAWIYYQNFELGRPNEVIDLYNLTPTSLFDGSGLGKVKGLFGYGLADGSTYNGVVSPDLKGMFIVGLDTSDPDYATVGATGGEKEHSLTEDEGPEHAHQIATTSTAGTGHDPVQGGADGAPDGRGSLTDGTGTCKSSGLGTPHENRPPFYTLIKAFKLF